ncbi:MAG: hypothetical protein F9K29_24250 [Hyphomicrobiaceae bacterium]|nr:MAG: hypothetical protein F9K29_24250 [Hyphomicrobiaceae bacterium]
MTIREFAGTLMLALAGALASVSAVEARAPWVMTTYRGTELSLDDCRARAQAAIRQAGFGEVQPSEWTVAGVRGDYTVVIGCAVESKLVYFISAGPERDTNVRHVSDLARRF